MNSTGLSSNRYVDHALQVSSKIANISENVVELNAEIYTSKFIHPQPSSAHIDLLEVAISSTSSWVLNMIYTIFYSEKFAKSIGSYPVIGILENYQSKTGFLQRYRAL